MILKFMVGRMAFGLFRLLEVQFYSRSDLGGKYSIKSPQVLLASIESFSGNILLQQLTKDIDECTSLSLSFDLS